MSVTNPPPIRVPQEFAKDPALMGYFQELHTFLRLLWARTGGGEDLVGGAAESIEDLTASLNTVISDLNTAESEIDALQAITGHDPVTVVDSDTVDLSLTEQEITASLTDSALLNAAMMARAMQPASVQTPDDLTDGLLHLPAQTQKIAKDLENLSEAYATTVLPLPAQTARVAQDLDDLEAVVAALPGGHSPVTVTDSDDIDFSLSGQDVSATLTESALFNAAMVARAFQERPPAEEVDLTNGLLHLPAQTRKIASDLDALEVVVAALPGGHSPVTVTDSADIDFTLTGQDVTAVLSSDVHASLNSADDAEAISALLLTTLQPRILDGSVSEIKLSESVNDSLDLADSASQPGHTHAQSDVTGLVSDLAGKAPTVHTHVSGDITDFNTAVAATPAVLANTAKVTNATHTGDVTGATALTIASGAVSNSKLANMAAGTIKGRASGAGTGAPVDLTATQARTLLNVANGATANSPDATLLARANHTGTQTASTISDFDTEVSNNATVVANELRSKDAETLASLLLATLPKQAAPDDLTPSLLHLPAQTRGIAQDHALLVAEVATLREEMSYLHGVLSQVNALKQRINEVELLCL